jgi:hypothetical protein
MGNGRRPSRATTDGGIPAVSDDYSLIAGPGAGPKHGAGADGSFEATEDGS